MTKRILDRDEFRAWLKTKGDEEVGRTRISCACPIATYLRSKGATADVYQSEFKYKQGWRRLPKWASSFVVRIDAQFGYLRPVNGAQSLKILDSI